MAGGASASLSAVTDTVPEKTHKSEMVTAEADRTKAGFVKVAVTNTAIPARVIRRDMVFPPRLGTCSQ
jgi:hypothetical protein